MLEKELEKRNRECTRLKEEIDSFNDILRGKEYYYKTAKDNHEYIANKTKDEVQNLRKLLLEEQNKNSKFEALQQEKQFLEQKFEMIKDELLTEKSRDNEIKLDAKVRELQREIQGIIYSIINTNHLTPV